MAAPTGRKVFGCVAAVSYVSMMGLVLTTHLRDGEELRAALVAEWHQSALDAALFAAFAGAAAAFFTSLTAPPASRPKA